MVIHQGANEIQKIVFPPITTDMKQESFQTQEFYHSSKAWKELPGPEWVNLQTLGTSRDKLS